MSEEISVEELMRRGAKRVEKPSELGSFARGAGSGVTLGFDDEQAGVASALGTMGGRGIKRLMEGRLLPDSIEEELEALATGYRSGRDEARGEKAMDERVNPVSTGAGRLGGAAATGILTGGAGAGLKGAVVAGGAMGAADGLGSSNADLTHGDVHAYARAFGDTLKGGAAGAAGGGVGYGIGNGLKALGGKAKDALANARGQMADDAAAQLVAEEEAGRAAAQANREGLEKLQGSALEMNKKLDGQAARRAAQEALRASRSARSGGAKSPKAPKDFEDTGVLRGYEGAARRRRADNSPKVLQARERLERGDISPQERLELEEYVAGHGAAVDAPLDFRRGIMREEMLRAGARPEQVERILAERFGPRGEALSRQRPPAAAAPLRTEPPALPERTQAMDLGDAVKQGRGPEMARAGGGGSAFDGWPTDARTLVEPPVTPRAPPRPSAPDTFGEAKTRLNLARTSPEQGIEGIAEHPMHTFEFQRGGELFEVVAMQPRPGELFIESVRPMRASTVEELHGELANSLGAGDMRALSYELAKAFPGVERISGQRMTGANVGHAVNVKAPQVTQMGRPDFPEDPTLAGHPDFFGPEHFEATNPGAAAPVRPSAPPHRAMGPGGEPQRGPALVPRPRRRDNGLAEDLDGRAPGLEDAPTNGSPNAQMAMRRAMAEDARVSGGRGEPTRDIRRPAEQPTEGAGFFDDATELPPRGPEPEAGLTVPYGGREQPNWARTAVGGEALQMPRRAPPAPAQDPTVRRSAPIPTEARRPPSPQPDMQDSLTRAGVHPDLGNLGERVAEREAGVLGRMGDAAWDGMREGHNVAAGLFGAVRGVTREALRDPAVRARALSALKLHRLAQLDPETFARVGSALQRAMAKGPEHARAARHVFLQTDPKFREADRKVEAEVGSLDDDRLLREVQRAGAN